VSLDELIKLMEALNRKPLRHKPTGLLVDKSPNATDLARQPIYAKPNAHQPSHGYGQCVTLEEAVKGVHFVAPTGPGFYLVEKNAIQIDPKADWVALTLKQIIATANSKADNPIAAALGNSSIRTEEVLFLDTETTGLSMGPLFLIGTMEIGKNGLRFRQYFARDYSEETSILSAVSERLKETRLLVTFNGKTFDVPYMHNRANATGISLHKPELHLDLLHEARKVYRGAVPNCRLQTLEQHICGRYREGDIPGSEIPAAYHEFVRTGNAIRMRAVIEHNVLDLYTMAELMTRMWNARQ